MNTELTDQEKYMLQAILENPSSAGPFAGMIYNSINDKVNPRWTFTDEEIRHALKNALRVRIVMAQAAGAL